MEIRRFVIVFNAEILYPSRLRGDLDFDCQGHSDPETLLAYLRSLELETGISMLNGMFRNWATR